MSKLAACGQQRMPPALKVEPLLDMRAKATTSVSCVTGGTGDIGARGLFMSDWRE